MQLFRALFYTQNSPLCNFVLRWFFFGFYWSLWPMFNWARCPIFGQMCDVSKHRRAFRLGRQRSEATPPPFRTLNGKLLLFRPLCGRNVRQTSAVLNGILQGAPLTPLHNAPQSERPAPATGNKSPMSNSYTHRALFFIVPSCSYQEEKTCRQNLG